MDVHFTYESKKPGGDIKQGDLLKITDQIRGILNRYHRHYANNPDYAFLMVITQSCDLAVSGRRCASRYISLAAVRPLETLIEQEIDRQSTSSIEANLKTFPEYKKHWMEDFVAKLLNNNLPGYFYLEPEVTIGIDRPYVAYLALSIAIKSSHYRTCKKARFVRLTEIFGAKLGWLVGNMYSRVATPDWLTEKFELKKDFENKVSGIVENSALWVPEVVFERLNVAQVNRREETGDESYRLTKEEIKKIIDDYRNEKRTKQANVTRFVVEEAEKAIEGVKKEQLKELESKLLNNQKLKALIT